MKDEINLKTVTIVLKAFVLIVLINHIANLIIS
jgi:hypothetical protein